jgi:tripartite-type tricarboxylate transporter receptor subunit TctC
VIPFAAGGQTDIIARLITPIMESELKQPVIVENRGGAGGMIGVDVVAKAAPDGYTLVITGGSAIGPAFIKGSTLEMYRDMTPISAIYEGPFMLFVQRSIPAGTVGELVAHLKANPGKYNYGSVASNETMLMEMFKRSTGTDIVQVPYKGGAPRIAAMLSNEVQFAVGATQILKQAGVDAKVRPMMAFGSKRSAQLPEVPTAAELGYAGLAAPSTLGLWGPPKLSSDIVAKLNPIVVKALAQTGIRDKIRDLSGMDPGGSAPEDLRTRSKAERDFYVEAAKLIKLEPQ